MSEPKKLFTKLSLATARPRYQDVEIENLGTVRLQAISTDDYYDLVHKSNLGSNIDPGDPLLHVRMLRDLYPAIVAYAVIDEEGQRVFTGAEDADLKLLRPMELMAIGNAAYEFWGFSHAPGVTAAVKN